LFDAFATGLGKLISPNSSLSPAGMSSPPIASIASSLGCVSQSPNGSAALSSDLVIASAGQTMQGACGTGIVSIAGNNSTHNQTHHNSKWAALTNTNQLLSNNLINNNLINNNLLGNNLINNFNNFLPSQLHHHHHQVNHHLVNHQLANHHSVYSIDSKPQIF
jgi:hypothetical protein